MNKEKPRISVWTKLIWAILFVFFSIHIAVWLTGYTYIYKTLIYTYPNIDDLDIFNSRIISSKNSSDWAIGKDYNKSKLPAESGNALLAMESVAFLVIKDDSLRYEEYWDGSNANEVSNSFSVAKSIVGILIGIAADEGRLNINDPVGKYLEEFSEGENAKLTIRHLLMMSSGLNWDESYNSLFSRTTEAYYGRNLNKIIEGLKVVSEPGKQFSYMSCNTLILGLIIEKVSGMHLSDYAAEKLWNPIEAVHPAFWSLDKADGMEKSYCCFYSTARDFARIGKLMLDSGTWNGKRILSKDYIQTSLSPVGIPDEQNKKVDYYGYHWWLLNHRDHRIFYARGILGQYIIVVPDEQMIIVRLGKQRGEKIPNNHYSDMIAYLDAALDTFCRSAESTAKP